MCKFSPWKKDTSNELGEQPVETWYSEIAPKTNSWPVSNNPASALERTIVTVIAGCYSTYNVIQELEPLVRRESLSLGISGFGISSQPRCGVKTQALLSREKSYIILQDGPTSES